MTYVTCVTLSYNNIQIKMKLTWFPFCVGGTGHTTPNQIQFFGKFQVSVWYVWLRFCIICDITILKILLGFKNCLFRSDIGHFHKSKSGPWGKGIECYQIPRYLFKLLCRRPGRWLLVTNVFICKVNTR